MKIYLPNLAKGIVILYFLLPLKNYAYFFHSLETGESVERASFIAREGTILDSQYVANNIQVTVDITIFHARETLQFDVKCNAETYPEVKCPFEGGLQVNDNEFSNLGVTSLKGFHSFDMTTSHSGVGLMYFENEGIGMFNPRFKKIITRHKIVSWYSSIFSTNNRRFYIKKLHYPQVNFIVQLVELINQIPAVSSMNESLEWITIDQEYAENQELMSLYTAIDSNGYILFQILLNNEGCIFAFTLSINGSFVSFWKVR